MRDASVRDRLFSKIMVAITEDWFALSHFRPLLRTLCKLCDELVVVTRCAGREREIEALGARVIPLSFRRKSLSFVDQGASVLSLARILEAEKPDVVHLVALNPIVIGAAAAQLTSVPAVVIHITGLGYLASNRGLRLQFVRRASFGVLNRLLRASAHWILAENESDLRDLFAFGVNIDSNATVVGGAGIDPQRYRPLEPPGNPIPIAAAVSRLIHSKGLDVLVAAKEQLAQSGIEIRVQVYGRPDPASPEAIDPGLLKEWVSRGTIEGGQEVKDVREVWKHADIAVLPARAREGMPRAMLEAAACARPLVVTDVPGLRDFVTNGREGIVVPPDDPRALADALGDLAADRALRVRMGEAARARILSGFTEQQVSAAIRRAYEHLAQHPAGRGCDRAE